MWARIGTKCLGSLLVAAFALCLHVLLAVWPAATAATSAPPGQPEPTLRTISILGAEWKAPEPDAVLLVAVVVLGALGASAHALTSFASYLGNRTFSSSWCAWYVVRMPVGSMLALVVYFVFRAGLLSNGSASALNPYGLAATATLAGMFSKQATDKLEELFSTLMRASGGDADRKDKLVGILRVESVTPERLVRGTPDAVLHLTGTGFHSGVTAAVGGEPRECAVRDPTAATVALHADDVGRPGTLVVVLTPAASVGGSPVSVEVPVVAATAESQVERKAGP